MERAERMILLGVGFLSSALLVPDLWVLLGLTSVTAIGRFVRVWRAAEGPAAARSASERRPVALARGSGRLALAGLARGRAAGRAAQPDRRAGGSLAGPASRGPAGQPQRAGAPGTGPRGARPAARALATPSS